MSTLDTGLTFIRTASKRVSSASEWLGRWFKELMPKGLYARALLIIIVPMVILQSVVAFVFMERHWNTVTRRLSASVVQDISALIDVYKTYPQDKDRTQIKRIAQQRLGLVVDFLPVNDMPAPGPKPFFSLLDQTLSVQLAPDRAAILDRHRRAFVAGGNPHQAGRYGDARLRAAQRSLCVELGDFHLLDAGDVIDPADRRRIVLAQSDQTDPAAGGRRRKFRQGPRGAGFPAAWCPRSAACGLRIP
jgi:hypothetical protein